MESDYREGVTDQVHEQVQFLPSQALRIRVSEEPTCIFESTLPKISEQHNRLSG